MLSSIINISILRYCILLTTTCFIGTIYAQSYIEDSIEIEQFILVDFCGPDFVKRDSLSVDINHPKTLSLLMNNISNSCFTGYEENFPIANYLIDRIDAIPLDTIISRIQINAIKVVFHLELLYYKLKALKDISGITISSEDFTHLHPHYFRRLKEILYHYSLE